MWSPPWTNRRPSSPPRPSFLDPRAAVARALPTNGVRLDPGFLTILEDNLYIAEGFITESNAQQLAKICGIVDALSLEVATSDEVRQLLSLKGQDQVDL